MLGQNGTVGQNGMGQNGIIPSYPPRSSNLPQCPDPFYPMPIQPTKKSVTKMIRCFWEEEVR